jgi:hypothetical protein
LELERVIISPTWKVTLCSPDGWFCNRTERPKGAINVDLLHRAVGFAQAGLAHLCSRLLRARLRPSADPFRLRIPDTQTDGSKTITGLFFTFGCGFPRCSLHISAVRLSSVIQKRWSRMIDWDFIHLGE